MRSTSEHGDCRLLVVGCCLCHTVGAVVNQLGVMSLQQWRRFDSCPSSATRKEFSPNSDGINIWKDLQELVFRLVQILLRQVQVPWVMAADGGSVRYRRVPELLVSEIA